MKNRVPVPLTNWQIAYLLRCPECKALFATEEDLAWHARQHDGTLMAVDAKPCLCCENPR